ncbi:PLP-dependent aminotransferase family protein [Paenibacillus motobuensis]|uniref:MocR-like pyridoxine biosynthesis transcription factor PdxR n=1 Tax=Paenibacillus TaxID=44249 RepID=UPI00203EE553|nr:MULTISPECIES: PLP-dependent aminotransferase family protein [Paenibacillus]MCM3039829.1 PLP-dependent aminotransferase family protein [Paenibacillus lutimineralis]MCM3646933.1 PLP-dependent aminotransferase family protein [Paenibacillus motobuensis]
MLKVNRDDKRPLWQQLLDQAIDHINNGVWKPGQRLTPTRELAQQLEVSRSTIQIVYDELLTRGYTVTSGRGGTRVNDWIQINDKCAPSLDAPQLPELPLLVEQSQHWFRSKDNQGSVIDFSPYQPFVDTQLLKAWRKSYLNASSQFNVSSWFYGDAYGFEPLRRQIQRYLSLERGIHVQTNQILLTSGAQHSIDLIAQTLLTKGDTITVEDPGYPVAWMTMKYRQMKVAPVPVDEHGLVVEKVPSEAKLILVTPAHQCAVGVMLSEPRRQQLLHRAAQQRAWIVEDDYDSEFRYRGDPMLTLFSQLPQNCLYLMSFSKLTMPGIRISAIIGPAEAIAQLARVQAFTYRHLPIMEQMALAHFIEHGYFMRHMRRARNIYRRRHEIMQKAIIASGLGNKFTLRGIETGLHVLLEADEAFDEDTMTRRALQGGVRVHQLHSYCLESVRKGWVLGFAKVDERLIVEGMYRLAETVL